jgi:2,5-diketo-D-gluconate reductase A
LTKQLPRLHQNNGQTIPQIGLGVDGTGNEVAAAAIESALGLGYRSIDTAAFYGNEPGVGEGIRRSGLPRDQVHVTTKIWGDSHGSETAVAAFERSLAALGLDYVDLYLIHWPHPQQDRYVETWQTLEEILAEGRAKSIGVSNFQPRHLSRLFTETSVRPVVNQIEVHPGFQNERLRQFNAEHNVLTQAWSPLGRGTVLGNPKLEAIARKHSRSLVQVVLRWHVEIGNIVIPKSVTPSRMRENIDIFDFRLDAHDHVVIRSLDSGRRTGDDPDDFG